MKQESDSISISVESIACLRQALPSLDNAEHEAVFALMEECVLPQGSDLYRAGDPAAYVAILLDGQLLVKREGRFLGKNILLAVLEPGALFGESSLCEETVRSCTVTASRQCRILLLPVEKFSYLLERDPHLAARFFKNVLALVSDRLACAGSRLAELL